MHLAEQAEVYIDTGTLARAVTVPENAVTGLANSRGTVWTVEDGKLSQRQAIFGPALLDGSLPIISGLPQDAQVVIGPMTGLRVRRSAVVARGAAP